MIYGDVFDETEGYYRSFELNEDWCNEYGPKRSPREYPYSYSAHYVWRDFDKKEMPKNISPIYSDRMKMWDRDKYMAVTKDTGWIEDISQSQAKNIIESYYDGKYECVGFARECNVSNGYGVGIFFIRAKNGESE